MANNETVIVSNNPAVWREFPDCIPALGSPVDVMREVRDRVHLGYRLVGHPLAGTIHLVRNPYRTVVLTQPEMVLDCGDILQVEEALWRLSQVAFDTAPEFTLSDYRFIDLELLQAFFKERPGCLRIRHGV